MPSSLAVYKTRRRGMRRTTVRTALACVVFCPATASPPSPIYVHDGHQRGWPLDSGVVYNRNESLAVLCGIQHPHSITLISHSRSISGQMAILAIGLDLSEPLLVHVFADASAYPGNTWQMEWCKCSVRSRASECCLPSVAPKGP